MHYVVVINVLFLLLCEYQLLLNTRSLFQPSAFSLPTYPIIGVCWKAESEEVKEMGKKKVGSTYSLLLSEKSANIPNYCTIRDKSHWECDICCAYVAQLKLTQAILEFACVGVLNKGHRSYACYYRIWIFEKFLQLHKTFRNTTNLIIHVADLDM